MSTDEDTSESDDSDDEKEKEDRKGPSVAENIVPKHDHIVCKMRR